MKYVSNIGREKKGEVMLSHTAPLNSVGIFYFNNFTFAKIIFIFTAYATKMENKNYILMFKLHLTGHK